MTMERTRLLDKVRALLAKTMGNGCTEFEALSALAKARAMIDAYEISDSELQLTKEEKAVIHPTGPQADKYGIRSYFDAAVAKFTDTECWINTQGGTTWCGMRADIEFAQWLSDHLATFVRGELASYLTRTAIPPYGKRRHINGFVMGCGHRISVRLNELILESRQKANLIPSESRALVLVDIKRGAIESAKADAGVHLRSVNRSRVSNSDSYAAGRAAGDRATFGRPVGGGGALRLK